VAGKISFESAPSAITSDSVRFRKLSVIVPAYNERSTITELLRRVCAVPIDKEIIVVDDGSSDGTREQLEKLRERSDNGRLPGAEGTINELKLIFHNYNAGKGISVRDGIAAAAGEIILIQDADLEYSPSEYPRLMQPILDGRADVVYGSRFTGTPRRVLFFWHAVGNKFLTFLSNMFTNLNLTDMETCYKVFRADLVKGLPLRSRRFGIEAELTAKVSRLRARIYEVPISYSGRGYVEGKKIGWKDGVAAVWTILKYAVVDDVDNADPAYKTLQRMEALQGYNRFLWQKIRPYVGHRVLEVGAGTGNMTRHIAQCEHVIATELNPRYLRILGNVFRNDPHVQVLSLDLSAPAMPPGLPNDFDTVVCLNVLEHIEDDVAALRRLHDVLAPGGRVVLIVPALRKLFGEIDRAVGHYRRYERAEIVAKLQQAGFQVEHSASFNTIGIPGWYLNSCLLKRRSVPGFQARLNSWLVPLLRFEERFQPARGMSMVVVGRRQL